MVLRSADDGRDWHVVLPPQRRSFGLVASYFLGTANAWAVDQVEHGGGNGETTTVLGTSDGGRHWWRSRPLPGDLTTCCTILFDQIFFSSPRHGWLLGVGTNINSTSEQSLTMLWWRTRNGGHTWTKLPTAALPLQGHDIGAYDSSACPVFSPPHLVFASARIGLFTEGACEHGIARPVLWRTDDGGSRWISTRLPSPQEGWGRWDVLDKGGTDVGAPYVVRSRAGVSVLVPVSLGRSRLVVERSLDMGRTWRIAGVVDSRAAPLQSTPADWFDPVDASDWVVTAPGGLVETTTGGRTWTFSRSPFSSAGEPASFTSPSDGFVLGSGLVAAMRTGDGGRAWTPEAVSVSAPEIEAWSTMTDAISTVDVVGSHFAVAAGGAGLVTSRDAGRSWVRRLGPLEPVTDVDFLDDRVGFVVANGELLRTLDGGANWRPMLPPVAGKVGQVEFWSARAGAAQVGQVVFITSDAGASWHALRLPSGYSLTSPLLGDLDQAGDVCFSPSGVAWVVATRAHRDVLLVSAAGDRHWRVALSARVFPAAAEPGRPGGGVMIAACRGDAAWVVVDQAAGPADMQGVPIAYDLLRSLDGGRSWLDVLRSNGPRKPKLARPEVAVPPGGPETVPAVPGPWETAGPLSAPSLTTAWLTFDNEDFGGLAFDVTGDGGLHWKTHRFPGSQQETASSLDRLPVDDQWLATIGLDPENAWVLLAGPKDTGDSYLYATSDSGAKWHRVAIFSWSDDTRDSMR